MTPGSLTDALKDHARQLGFELAGATPAARPPGIERFHQWLAEGCAGQMRYLADRAGAYEHPRHILERAKSVLVLGSGYCTDQPAEAAAGEARVSRYAWGADYHDVIRRRLRRLADFHRRLVPGASVRGIVDTAPLWERRFGQLAGLGWIGKNTCLLNERLGSWFFLAALLSSEELRYDQPCDEDRCGTCRACLDACPSGALTEPYRLDARKCVSYLSVELRGCIPAELRAAVGQQLFGCDACQEACPWNRQVPRCSEAAFAPRAGMNPVQLSELFAMSEAEFERRFRDTPLWRAGYHGILRNAAIVLGNRPHEAALPALYSGLRSAEATVRSACAWALGRYPEAEAADVLRESLAVESESEVRREIEAALHL